MAKGFPQLTINNGVKSRGNLPGTLITEQGGQ